MPAWHRLDGDTLTLIVHAQPGAKKSGIAGLHGDALKVRVAAPAQDGRANEALAAFLAAWLGVPVSAVTLAHGETSRHKRFVIRGVRAVPEVA